MTDRHQTTTKEHAMPLDTNPLDMPAERHARLLREADLDVAEATERLAAAQARLAEAVAYRASLR